MFGHIDTFIRLWVYQGPTSYFDIWWVFISCIMNQRFFWMNCISLIVTNVWTGITILTFCWFCIDQNIWWFNLFKILDHFIYQYYLKNLNKIISNETKYSEILHNIGLNEAINWNLLFKLILNSLKTEIAN